MGIHGIFHGIFHGSSWDMRGFLMQNEFEMMQNDAKNRTKKYVPSGVIIAVAGKSPINGTLGKASIAGG